MTHVCCVLLLLCREHEETEFIEIDREKSFSTVKCVRLVWANLDRHVVGIIVTGIILKK